MAMIAETQARVRRTRCDRGELEARRQLQATLAEIAASYGFYSAFYMHLGHVLRGGRGSANRDGPRRCVASSPTVDDRIVRQLFDSAFLTQAAVSMGPFAYNAASFEAGLLEGRVILAAPVQDYAAGPGVLVLLGVDFEKAKALAEEERAALSCCAIDVHTRVLRDLPASGAAPRGALTQRELDCLRLAALGYTVSETAALLLVTPRTVEFHLNNCASKFGTMNKVHTVAMAISQGIVTV